MNVLANHQITHKDELADHQINKPVHTNELAKEFILVVMVHGGKDQDVVWTIRTAQIREN
ncbi:hypothetical protein YC2023_109141 [Brassica napus]